MVDTFRRVRGGTSIERAEVSNTGSKPNHPDCLKKRPADLRLTHHSLLARSCERAAPECIYHRRRLAGTSPSDPPRRFTRARVPCDRDRVLIHLSSFFRFLRFGQPSLWTSSPEHRASPSGRRQWLCFAQRKLVAEFRNCILLSVHRETRG